VPTTIDNTLAARYLDVLGFTDTPRPDRTTLEGLQLAHLRRVPFENLDIACGTGVPHDVDGAIDKIVERRRGGWCFELNGAFAALLDHIGYEVRLLGAAVLVGGPTTVIDHLALEVAGGPDRMHPMLVDVGFGDSFDVPLELNQPGIQTGGHARYELFPSPLGTTLAEIDDGVPTAQYRFKRVGHRYSDFAAIAAELQNDRTKHWSTKPFATRLLDDTDRIVLTHDRLKIRRRGSWEDETVARADWDAVLERWFGLDRPGPWPTYES